MTDVPHVRLAEIAATPGRLPDRAQALLQELASDTPFDAAWIALAEPLGNGYTSLASATTVFAYRDGVLRADRDGAHTPPPRAVRVLVHAPDGAVEEHLQPHDERHWRLGGTA